MTQDASGTQPHIPADWTVDPESGRSNSSAEYLRLCARVGEIIRASAHDLIAGRADRVGELVMAQLAHAEHLVPADYQGVDIMSIQKDGDGNLIGIMSLPGQVLRFTTQPYAAEAPAGDPA